jgi:hypothetical protein
MFEKKTSEAQIRANRENAQKSTGPNIDEGKQRCRLNAGRHHLTGTVYTMTEEDRIAWKEISVAFADEFQPQTHFERQLIEGMAHDQWRMNRARAIEENALTAEMPEKDEPLRTGHPQVEAAFVQCRTFFLRSEIFLRLSLYEQRLQRSFEKKLKLFREARTERELTRTAEPPAKALSAGQSFPGMEDAAPETAPESTTCPEIGSVFSNDENEPSHPEPATQEVPKSTTAPVIPILKTAVSISEPPATPQSPENLSNEALKIAV